MPKTEILHPDKKVSTGAYSAGVLVDGWLYISGQGSLALATGEVKWRFLLPLAALSLGPSGRGSEESVRG